MELKQLHEAVRTENGSLITRECFVRALCPANPLVRTHSSVYSVKGSASLASSISPRENRRGANPPSPSHDTDSPCIIPTARY